MRVQVFGAGSLGTLVGALLARGGVDVGLVARDRVARAFKDGVRVEGVDGFVAHPSLSTEAVEADVTLVTVKSYDTAEAARELAGKTDLVVSLQNGMGNEEVLDEALDAAVLGGTATYGANLRLDEGYVEYTGKGEVVVGDYRGGPSDEADGVAAALDGVRDGIDARATDSMDAALWEKLAVNAAINPVTALTGLRNGEASERVGEVMRRAADEVEDVAAEHGVRLDGAAETALSIARSTAENESSMLQDMKAGRRTEVDALNGYVVERAEETDLEVPTNRTLASLVRAQAEST